jgi:predicted HAD superfamily Cof-like phosphohydrolase
MSYDATKHETVGSLAASMGETHSDTRRRFIHSRPLQERVRYFHKKFDGTVRDEPYEPTYWQVQHRSDLIREEWQELDAELGRSRPDLTFIAHEAADLLIVLYGLAVELGFDLNEVAHAVMDANMTKDYAGPDCKPTKGENFVPANVRSVVHG